MNFHHANCELCKQDVFRESDLIAMQANRTVVDLRGQQPWCGVRTICLDCARVVAETLGSRDESHRAGVSP